MSLSCLSIANINRNAIKEIFGRGNAVNAFRMFSASNKLQESCKVLIVGGGSGGCALAAKLSSKLGKGKVVVLDSNERHYYQPMFTLIGGGMKTLKNSYRDMQQVLPASAKWIKEKAVSFDPKNNSVTTESGQNISYDILLLAMGMQLNYDKISGLTEALSIPNGNVCSIYSPKYVDRTYEILQRFEKGNAVFTFPMSPIKCPGAPQKIMYIAEHYFRKNNKRQHANIIYNTTLPVLFGVKRYADALWKVVDKRDIKVNLRRNLIQVRANENIAVFEDLDNPGSRHEINYSMLHAVPPMSAPNELSQCTELVNAAGYVDVSSATLQHIKHKNVYAIGDCSATPNSKTAASAAAQSPVVYKNILATLNGREPKEVYDGYASCPLVTGYDSCILAEFDYDLNPLETFPIAQNKERYSMFVMKKELMPALYWQLMLPGYWNGPALMRNAMSIFKFGKN